jgi:predicted dehydrogenase
MSEVRVAVVGVGRIGLTHAETLARRTRGARLVAVTTSSAERSGQIRDSFGEVAIYPGLDQLLEAKLPVSPQRGPHGKPSSPKKGNLRRNQQA